MTDDERRKAILQMIRDHSEKCKRDPEYARQSLIDEGFLTAEGKLHPNYGGKDT